MNSPAFTSSLAQLAAVGLAELVDRAALQTRVDRKYVVPLDQLPHLLDQLVASARVLEIDGERVFRTTLRSAQEASCV